MDLRYLGRYELQPVKLRQHVDVFLLRFIAALPGC